MAVQNHSPFPGFSNLRLEEVSLRYGRRGKAEFDMCLVTQEDVAPMRFKPEAIVLLSELAIGRERQLSLVERTLLGGLPEVFAVYKGLDMAKPSQKAMDARYTFYHR